jgi:hypothetical protein
VPGDRQDARLDGDDAGKPRTRGAYRQSNGKFTLTMAHAGQQQVREVHARDQQHQPGHAHQQ